MKIALIILVALFIALNLIYIHLIEKMVRTRKGLLLNRSKLKRYILQERHPRLDIRVVDKVLDAQEEYIIKRNKEGKQHS